MAQDNQKVIVSQSMLKFTQEYSKQINQPFKLKEMVAITNVLVDYCMNGYSKEIGDRLDSVDKFISDKFQENQ
jgi:hypothetical protein